MPNANTRLQRPAYASRIGLIERYYQRTAVPEVEIEGVVLVATGFAIWLKNNSANDALIAIKSNIYIYWLRRWSVQTGIPTLESGNDK